MPALTVHLLGRPAIRRDGVAAPRPRGRKAWTVLAYLALAEHPVPRARLAGLMFADADDPLGALRWTLAQLRRALALPDVLRGDPLVLELPAGSLVDLLALTAGVADPALVRGDLLEDCDPSAGAALDAWLLVERRRLAGLCEAVLRDAALQALGAGIPLEGAALASRALAFGPFDETLHELLVRCLSRAAQPRAARRQAQLCEELFRRELGRDPDPRVRRAAEPALAGELAGATGDRVATLGLLEAGLGALAAGAAEPGVQCLRMASAEARAHDDPVLIARVLVELGAALIHAVRGRDEEGSALLHEAHILAERHGDRAMATRVCRELGYVEVQAGRPSAAGRWLERATALAGSPGERAAVLGVRGMALSDRAHYRAAIDLLSESATLAESCGATRQVAWSLALLGRARLLCGQVVEASAALDRSLERVRACGWVAFGPLPEALRAEVMLAIGDLDAAGALADRAFASGCRLGDPCWEAIAGRVGGLVSLARGDRPRALQTLRDACRRAVRVPDPYLWVYAHCLDAAAGVAVETGAPDGADLVSELERLAARSDMRELIVRAAIHRARLGDPGGIEAMRPLAEAIVNPALHAALADLTGVAVATGRDDHTPRHTGC